MPRKTTVTRDWIVEHGAAAIAFGRIGDAMGTPTENLEPAQIEERFGWVQTYEGDGTDDSIMAQMIAAALLRTDGYANADDWARECHEQRGEIFGDKVEKFFASVLHALRKIQYGSTPRQVALGNMPSSSSAMAIVPVGIVNAGHPRAAAMQAAEIASLLHTGDVAFCQDGAAAIAAAVAAALGGAATIDEVVSAAVDAIKPWSGAEMLGRINEAVALARDSADYKAFRSAYHARFRTRIACDSRETVPATLALAVLAKGDPVAAVTFGANFGRDADTIACMAGYVCGAFHGLGPLRASDGLYDAGIVESSTAMAARLFDVGQRKARLERDAWLVLAEA